MNWVRILRDICARPQAHWSAYQIYCRYHKPTEFSAADPTCKHCKGKGWWLVQLDEFDVEKDICPCVEEFEVI